MIHNFRSIFSYVENDTENENDNENGYENEIENFVREIEVDPLEYNSRSYRSGFNCGGFALQTLDWYMPESWVEHRDARFEEEYNVIKAFERCSFEVERDYNARYDGIDKLVPIDHYSDAPVGVEVVAFRLAYDELQDEDTGELYYEMDDFHFAWRDAKGKWWDKPGWGDVKELGTDPEEDWNGRYDGPITWYAKVS